MTETGLTISSPNDGVLARRNVDALRTDNVQMSPDLGPAALDDVSPSRHRPGSPHSEGTTSPQALSPRTFLCPPGRDALGGRGSVSHDSGSSRRRGREYTISLWRPRTPQPLRSPIIMIVFFMIGLGLSLAHCIFYPKLHRRIVGNSDEQEEKLRVGTALSFLTQMALTASVWKAYTQWLWRAVYANKWTPKGLNKAFSADTAPAAIFSWDMFKNFKLGIVMAFFAWCLILPPFFTPAALYVYKSTNQTTVDLDVPFLAIGNSTAGGEFSYSPPKNSSTIKFKDDTTRIFAGPRTVITLLASATASRGEILEIESPTNHSAYSVNFFGPIVRCSDADDPTRSQIERLLKDHMEVPKGSSHQVDSAYYGFVPGFDSDGELMAASKPRYETSGNMTNEFWMTFQRYVLNEKGERSRTRKSQVCRLHNATYSLDLEWDRGKQTVKGKYDTMEVVEYPEDEPGQVSNMANHAYAAFMWALTDQLVGSLGWFKENATSGRSDLDVYFDFNTIYNLYVYDNETAMSSQRLQDKVLAQNRTLEKLVEELSFNTTVSLMKNRLLTYSTTRQVTKWEDVNRYAYIPTSLFIPYGLANLVSLFAVVAGLISFVRHKTNPDKTFQDIANAATDSHIVRIIGDPGETTEKVHKFSFTRTASIDTGHKPSISVSMHDIGSAAAATGQSDAGGRSEGAQARKIKP